jgi:hypothetical protein
VTSQVRASKVASWFRQALLVDECLPSEQEVQMLLGARCYVHKPSTHQRSKRKRLKMNLQNC